MQLNPWTALCLGVCKIKNFFAKREHSYRALLFVIRGPVPLGIHSCRVKCTMLSSEPVSGANTIPSHQTDARIA